MFQCDSFSDEPRDETERSAIGTRTHGNRSGEQNVSKAFHGGHRLPTVRDNCTPVTVRVSRGVSNVNADRDERVKRAKKRRPMICTR
jgi:hypothetical protein